MKSVFSSLLESYNQPWWIQKVVPFNLHKDEGSFFSSRYEAPLAVEVGIGVGLRVFDVINYLPRDAHAIIGIVLRVKLMRVPNLHPCSVVTVVF